MHKPSLLAALLLVPSCGGGAPDPKDSGTAPDAGTPTEAALEPLFSFVVFADPHITAGNLEHQERLAAAVEWVNLHADERDIALVWVVGDIGWSGGLPVARALLEELEVPWVPVMGDNEVHIGAEQTFDEVFTDQYDHLASITANWQRGAVAVHDPGLDRDVWLQNFAFDHRGIRWIGLDWISRVDGLLGEFGELNDYPDGSLPFFSDEVDALADGPAENVLLFSHHAMHFGAFDLAEIEQLVGITGPRGDRIAANYAGHYHVTYEEWVEDGHYDVFVTDATWDDENTIRVVQVLGNGVRFAYEQELVVLPP